MKKASDYGMLVITS